MTVPFPIKDTIVTRRSTRSYKMIPVGHDVMNEIKAFADA